jgi:hypothetical protein
MYNLPSSSSKRRSRCLFGFGSGVGLPSLTVLVGTFFAGGFFLSSEDDSDESVPSSSEESTSASSLSDSSDVSILSSFPDFFTSAFFDFVSAFKIQTQYFT